MGKLHQSYTRYKNTLESQTPNTVLVFSNYLFERYQMLLDCLSIENEHSNVPYMYLRETNMYISINSNVRYLF